MKKSSFSAHLTDSPSNPAYDQTVITPPPRSKHIYGTESKAASPFSFESGKVPHAGMEMAGNLFIPRSDHKLVSKSVSMGRKSTHLVSIRGFGEEHRRYDLLLWIGPLCRGKTEVLKVGTYNQYRIRYGGRECGSDRALSSDAGDRPDF
jgi:hypothetical protein